MSSNQFMWSSDLLTLFPKLYNQRLVSIVALRILSGKRTGISATFRDLKWKYRPAVQKLVIKVDENKDA